MLEGNDALYYFSSSWNIMLFSGILFSPSEKYAAACSKMCLDVHVQACACIGENIPVRVNTHTQKTGNLCIWGILNCFEGTYKPFNFPTWLYLLNKS